MGSYARYGKVNANVLWTMIVVGLITINVLQFFSKTSDPLVGKGPAYVAYFMQEKTLCEGYAQRLRATGVDGNRAYLEIQQEANGCIGYLQAVVDQGHQDSAETLARMEKVRAAGARFRKWADENQKFGGPIQTKMSDPTELLDKTMKLLNSQEQDRRKAVKDTFEKCKFRSWQDLGAGN